MFGKRKIAGVNGYTYLVKLGAPGITCLPAAGSVRAAVGTAAIPVCAAFCKHIISLVDFFHFFLRQVGQRIIVVVVGMIFPDKLTICFFNFFIACVLFNA